MTSPHQLLIDEDSFVPLPEQIRRGVSEQVVNGLLPVGARLPSVRQLARDLALAPGTVAKAYQLLESDGVIVTRGRHGTYVSARPARAIDGVDAVRAAVRRFLAEAAHLGLSPEAALAAAVDVVQAAEREGAVSPL